MSESMSEAPKPASEKEISYSDFQDWCENMAVEMKAVAELVAPNEKGIIEEFVVSVDSERLAQQASFGVDNGESEPAHLLVVQNATSACGVDEWTN